MLFRTLGKRFRTVGWICIAVLLLTGIGNLYFRDLLRMELLTDLEFWSSSYGTTLAWKLGCVGCIVSGSALHDFVLGPRAGRLDPNSQTAEMERRRSAYIARANVIVGLALLIVAVRLARGG